jgi:hypothetical protein
LGDRSPTLEETLAMNPKAIYFDGVYFHYHLENGKVIKTKDGTFPMRVRIVV